MRPNILFEPGCKLEVCCLVGGTSTTKRDECETRKSEEGCEEENCCLHGLLDDVEIGKRIQERIPKNTRVRQHMVRKRLGRLGHKEKQK